MEMEEKKDLCKETNTKENSWEAVIYAAILALFPAILLYCDGILKFDILQKEKALEYMQGFKMGGAAYGIIGMLMMTTTVLDEVNCSQEKPAHRKPILQKAIIAILFAFGGIALLCCDSWYTA